MVEADRSAQAVARLILLLVMDHPITLAHRDMALVDICLIAVGQAECMAAAAVEETVVMAGTVEAAGDLLPR
jgi:hypothetical protein